jgi:hypothetical protein
VELESAKIVSDIWALTYGRPSQHGYSRRRNACVATRRYQWPERYPTPAAALAIARQLEFAARAEAIAAIRRLRGEGRSWQVIASLLGFDSLPDGGVVNPARLGFDYAAGLPRPPLFGPPQFVWVCPECAEVVGDTGPVGSPRQSQRGHSDGCKRLAAEVEAWDGQSAAEMRDEGT